MEEDLKEKVIGCPDCSEGIRAFVVALLEYRTGKHDGDYLAGLCSKIGSLNL